jgi:hypothetical protein
MRNEKPHDSVGLCAACTHARVQANARGSSFWRCGRADSDARFPKYPPLPVRECPGHAPGEPQGTHRR